MENTLRSLPEVAPTLHTVDGGHMLYRKMIVENPDGTAHFIKSHDASLFTDTTASEHSRQYLYKEAAVFAALRDGQYPHIPAEVLWTTDALVMPAYRPETDWHWKLPENPELQQQYVQDVLEALTRLESCPPDILPPTVGSDSLSELSDMGWASLLDTKTKFDAYRKLGQYSNLLHKHVLPGARKLFELLEGNSLADFATGAQSHAEAPRTCIAHFDARQSNIAWHPEHGVSIVDWSWAASAPIGCDRTMFVIDLFKSGWDVSPLLGEHLDTDHAFAIMGYWLRRSLSPTPTDNRTVRFHQLASAASAATLVL